MAAPAANGNGAGPADTDKAVELFSRLVIDSDGRRGTAVALAFLVKDAGNDMSLIKVSWGPGCW